MPNYDNIPRYKELKIAYKTHQFIAPYVLTFALNTYIFIYPTYKYNDIMVLF